MLHLYFSLIIYIYIISYGILRIDTFLFQHLPPPHLKNQHSCKYTFIPAITADIWLHAHVHVIQLYDAKDFLQIIQRIPC